MIPNIVHFVYGLKSDFGGKGFSFVHFLAIFTAWKVNRPETIFFHYAYEPTGEWWEKAKPYLTLNHISPPAEIFGRPLEHFAHKADVVRLEMLMKYGGIYLDIDVVCISSLKPLLQETFVLGREPGFGLCNAVILSSPDSEFLRIWYDRYHDFDGAHWGYHSVKLPLELAKQHPTLIRVLDSYAFFYPLHNDPTHEALWSDKPLLRQRLVLKKVIGHVGARMHNLFSSKCLELPYPPLSHLLGGRQWQLDRLSQSFCIHLWESIWWEHLQGMTPEAVADGRGNFPRIIQQVVGQDLMSIVQGQ
jgi:hypothetical protein